MVVIRPYTSTIDESSWTEAFAIGAVGGTGQLLIHGDGLDGVGSTVSKTLRLREILEMVSPRWNWVYTALAIITFALSLFWGLNGEKTPIYLVYTVIFGGSLLTIWNIILAVNTIIELDAEAYK